MQRISWSPMLKNQNMATGDMIICCRPLWPLLARLFRLLVSVPWGAI